MTAHMVSVLGPSHALEFDAILCLVLIFLIIEIPLVVSIFKAGSMDEDSQETDRGPFARPIPGPDGP